MTISHRYCIQVLSRVQTWNRDLSASSTTQMSSEQKSSSSSQKQAANAKGRGKGFTAPELESKS
jgi:hypothetical protein